MADKRIFKRRLQRPSLNIAISVLLDMSGSMAGYAQYLCAQLGYILAETCGLIRVPFECLGFTTGYVIGGGCAREVPGIYYHRTNPLKLIIVKPFEMTSRSDILHRMYAAAAWNGGGTTEGEAIWWAARRLSKQPRQRKLLITICDGAPNGHPAPDSKFKEHVTCVIKRLHAAHIETMHVGVGTNEPKSYVPQNTFVRYDGIDSLITEFAPAFGGVLLRERSRIIAEEGVRDAP
jgi:cobaltochelatase CobT